MTTLNKFNNKDLLRDIRVGVLNPMVDATNNNTLDINTLRGNVAGLSKRLGFIEPEVSTNSRNLTALNQFAHAVAQQVSMTYDKSRIDPSNKLITFTAVGGTEKTLDLSPMFIDPIQTKIDISALENDPGVVHSVHQVNFKGNVKLSMDTTDRNRGDVFIPYLRGKIGDKSSNISKVEITGNTKSCTIDKGVLTIDIPDASGSGGPGGLFLEPNPPEAGKNLFKADTQAAAEALRDAHFTSNPTDLATYQNNTLKAILVEWTSGTDVQLMFQCQHNGNWENPFDIVFTSFIIGKHGIEELKDGSRVVTLESETLIGAAGVGTGVPVYYNIHGRNLQLRNLRSNSEDLVVSTNDTGANEIVFHTKPYWAGYFDNTNDASTAIPESDRIANKTTILTKNAHSEHALHVWDGNAWTDKNIAEHADISSDGGVNWLTMKGLINGDNIALTKVDVSGGGYYHRVDAISPVFAQITGKTPARITTVEVANQYAEVQGSTLKLPVISAIDTASGDLGQIKNIKQGDNIQFDRDANGVLVISSDKTDPMQAQVGSQTTYTQISKIKDPSTFSTIEGGVLTLHRLNAVKEDGSNVGHVRSVKAGANMDFSLDSGGLLTISSTGGGGETTFVQAKTGVTGSTYAPVSKINIIDPFSKVEDQTLTVNAINCKDVSGTNQGFIKTLKAGANITLSYDNSSLDTGTVTISSTGGGAGSVNIMGKVTGGNFANQFLPITKINVTTDSNLSNLVKNDGEETYTMSFDSRSFVASNSTKAGLEAAFPVSSNAYRHGYVGDTGETYFTEGTSWFLQNYKGMPEQVRSLNGRYPGLHTSAGAYDENNIESGMYYVTRVQCPLKPDEQKELGIVENLTISKTKRAQFFWGMESGNLWYRRMDPSTTSGEEKDFLEWNLINGLGDDYYSILTVPSIKVDATRSEINGTKALSWMVLQDPRCNVSVDGGSNSYKFRVNRTGVYSITMCAHITSAADLATEASSKGATYTFTLFEADSGTMVRTPISKTGVKVPARPAFNKGMYPPVRMTFPELLMKAGTLYKVTLNHSRNDGLSEIYLDSFKNYLVIQPASSGTKQGTVIAETLRTTLGGFSSKAGYEVHVEGVKANSEYVRVFGNVMNDSLVTG